MISGKASTTPPTSAYACAHAVARTARASRGPRGTADRSTGDSAASRPRDEAAQCCSNAIAPPLL